jgi:predicted secreted acid phosphatase
VDRALQTYVDARLKSGASKPAVVFDIDDTALSSFSYERAHQFAYDVASWDTWERTDGFPAIAPTLANAKHLVAEHVAIFFVTGRRRTDLAVTRQERTAAGYPTPAGLFLRPVSDHSKAVIPFKSHAREQIEVLGYLRKRDA